MLKDKINKSFILYLIATGFARGTPLILMPLYLNTLSVSFYSQVILIVLVGKILSRFLSLSGSTTLLFETRGDLAKGHGLLAVYNTSSLISTAVLGLALSPIALYLGSTSVFFCCLLIGFSEALFGLKSSYFRAISKPKSYFNLAIGRFAIETLAILSTYYFKLGISEFCIFLALGQVLICFPSPWSWPSKDLWNSLSKYKYVLAFTPNAVFGWVMNSSDRFVIKYFIGDLGVTKYSIGYNISSILLLLTATLAVWLPSEISSNFESWRKKKKLFNFLKVMSGLSLLVLVCELLLFYLDEKFIGLLKFYDRDIYVVIFLATFGIFFTGINSYTSSILTYCKLTKIIFCVNLGMACLNVGLNLILIHFIGFVGAAIATLVCFFIQFLIFYSLASPLLTGEQK